MGRGRRPVHNYSVLYLAVATTFYQYIGPGGAVPYNKSVKFTPTAEERRKLDKVSRAKHIHFILLVVLICIASLTFLFPNDISSLAAVVLSVSIVLVGLSSMSLQHFQRCPRCSTRMSRGQSACAGCGLEYYASDTDTQSGGSGT